MNFDLKDPNGLKSAIEQWLDDDKAQDIETIDLRGQTSIADFMIVASGRSSRQTTSLMSNLKDRLSKQGLKSLKSEGETTGDWVILDAGDVIVHLFRPEVREFYNIEQMWSMSDKELEKSLKVVPNEGDGLRA